MSPIPQYASPRRARRNSKNVIGLLLSILLGSLGQATVVFSSSPAVAQTVLEKMIAAENPCKGAKIKVGFLELGVDNLKGIKLEKADVTLRGDAITATFAGSLSCKTSDSAMIEGDASTQIESRAKVDLASCDVENVVVSLSNFGGTFGGALELISKKIETELADVARNEIASACQGFRDDV